MDIMKDFTIEEIMLIKSCNTRSKKSALKILQTYEKIEDAGINEISYHTRSKLYDVTEQEFLELVDYPI